MPLLLFMFFAASMGFVIYSRQAFLTRNPSVRAQREQQIPKRILWAWERPEDLRTVDSRTTGIAVLEQTIVLGATVVAAPRRQPIIVPEQISRIAVARIETRPEFSGHIGDQALLEAAVADLAALAERLGVAALQVDFDAARSQRGFYRRLLTELRLRMPPGLPLHITALASWCSVDDWLVGLPIEEATPMFFRLEPDRRRIFASDPAYQVREPLCQGSVGVSTHEPWPSDIANKRVYLFADRGWARDSFAIQANTAASERFQ